MAWRFQNGRRNGIGRGNYYLAEGRGCSGPAAAQRGEAKFRPQRGGRRQSGAAEPRRRSGSDPAVLRLPQGPTPSSHLHHHHSPQPRGSASAPPAAAARPSASLCACVRAVGARLANGRSAPWRPRGAALRESRAEPSGRGAGRCGSSRGAAAAARAAGTRCGAPG